VGVTTKKKTIPIIKGETILPSIIPILNQILFNGVRILEFVKANIRKANEIIKDHTLKLSLFSIGYKETIKKNIKKTIPKLLLELILISSI